MRIVAALVAISMTYVALAGANDVAAAISFAGITPNPWVAAATYVLVAGRWPARYWVSAAIGLAADLNGFSRLGIAALAYFLVGYLAISLLAHLRRQGPSQQALAALPIVTALVCCEALGHFVLGESAYRFSQLCGLALWTGVYTSLICGPLLLIRSWWRELSSDRAATFAIR